ncbi:selenide, water dikinase SelD [Bacillus infantis]|uniref:Selenide, water dikinase SelD n=1 Tax=Bacillus infantis TaxID=324767 RepID=A0A5D4R601_9BACI|nr:selenide, water dikinase SelD [Bacillus infantis]TYS46807.1 selenide, water dikinase SelD [Bacillus infantis]
MRSSDLTQVLRNIPIPQDDKLLAGLGEDALGYKWQNEIMVQSVVLITPIVDDPYQFGAIAAANALSDLYAKGADSIFGLNIIGFPSSSLPLHYLEEIIKGGVEKIGEAGAYIAGGHTIDDTSPKYGLAVTGKIPAGEKFIQKNGACPGDAIVITKPIGNGIYTTAIDQKTANREQQEIVVAQMMQLNKEASLAMRKVNVHACTDITGFGLLGHLFEIADKSQISIELDLKKVPYLNDVFSLLKSGATSEGMFNNLFTYKNNVRYTTTVTPEEEWLLHDPQTSGGLLIVLPQDEAKKLQLLLSNAGVKSHVIGKVIVKSDFSVITKNSII